MSLKYEPVSGNVITLHPQVPLKPREREFFIDNLLVRIHTIIEIIWWTGLAPWEIEFPFPGTCSLTSTFQVMPRYPLHVPSSCRSSTPELLEL